MAETMGLIASVGALVDPTLNVLKTLYQFYADLKSAPARSAELHEDLNLATPR